jgi:RNA polymerase sigma-54 factor
MAMRPSTTGTVLAATWLWRPPAAHPQEIRLHSLSLQVTSTLQPTLSPRLQRAVKLLQMSSLDFSQAVRDALDNNPFLETDETAPVADLPLARPDDAAEPPLDGSSWGAEPISRSRMVDGDGVFDTLVATSLAGSPPDGPAEPAAAARTRLGAGGRRHRVARRRRLPAARELVEVGALVPLEPPPKPKSCRSRCGACSRWNPAWARATSSSACGCSCPRSKRPRAARWPRNASCATACNASPTATWQTMARRLGVPVAEGGRLRRIRRLDPRPGWRFGAAEIQYITPDVMVRKVRNQWTRRSTRPSCRACA